MSWQENLVQILDPTLTLPIAVRGDETGEPSYELLVWESTDVPKPTEEQFLLAVAQARGMSYRTARRTAYPPVSEQLDTIFHHGIDVWREQIQTIKDEFPKP
jgi:hypothetical protein